MPGVTQRRTKLSGQWYEKGETVPDELVTGRNVATGLVVRSAASDEDVKAELEATKAALESALDRLTAAGVSTEGIVSAPAFDPADHKVDEVLAHVDANPDDLGRVLDAELGGKARKTLLDDLSRRQDEAEASEGDDDTGGSAEGE